MIVELNTRSREVFRHIVDTYVETGEPVGSRTIARRLEEQLSAATIRNVMADLEESGLLYAPHTSAGRLPTDLGLRFYVDGLLEVGTVDQNERLSIESQCVGAGRSVENLLADAVDTLSGLSRFAGLVMSPNSERPFKHVEFVPLGGGRALVIVVTDNGMVENRVVEIPLDMPVSTLIEAGNYLTARLAGRNFSEARLLIEAEIKDNRARLDELTRSVVATGLATWSDDQNRDGGVLIVRGQSNLLEKVTNLVELERIRSLFELLETRTSLLKLIELTQQGRGVQVFIGAENELFSLSGCSVVIAPYQSGTAEDGGSNVVGAIGVIGPTRMNYARIVPMVDYTARVVSRLLGGVQSEKEK
ncbi:MAG: heat-inducible transcriptional repressor HrcA [Pseudomonadota bacterium]